MKAALCVTAVALSIGTAQAHDYYVAPTGTAPATGTRADPLDIETALGPKSPAHGGDTVFLLGGTYDGKMNGISRLPFVCAISGNADAAVVVEPAPGEHPVLNGTIALTSSYARYRDLEIGDLAWDLTQQNHKNEPALNVTAGTGTKIIDCNLFGGAMGIGAWSGATDLEISGCLVHDFGYLEATGRGHGHAYYAQNATGTKTFANNICYRGAGWNVHIYTERGQIQGFDILHNICYIAGALKPNQTTDNFLICGYTPADRIRLIGNIGYQPSFADHSRPDARMSTYANIVNGTGEMTGNTFIGAPLGVVLSAWKRFTMHGNTLWAHKTLVDFRDTPTQKVSDSYAVDDNTYLSNAYATPFKLGGKAVDSSAWQAAGLDRGGKFVASPTGLPQGTQSFVLPSPYQKGRASIGIFNWNGQPTSSLDLSAVLTKGQRFAVYNCLDITQTIAQAAPMLQATYDGLPVSLPLRHAPISPNFDAFLLLPEN